MHALAHISIAVKDLSTLSLCDFVSTCMQYMTLICFVRLPRGKVISLHVHKTRAVYLVRVKCNYGIIANTLLKVNRREL